MNKKLRALVNGLNLGVAAKAETPSLEKICQLIQEQ